MYNVSMRIVNNESDAEDILQNSFIDVFTKIHSFQFRSSIGAWIKRIVINNSINFLKSRRMKIEEFNVKTIEDKQENNQDIDQNLSVEKIKRAIDKLPAGYRIVFSLYLLEGYDHKEIAKVLDISESTSKSQYSRAKQKIKELLRSNELELKVS